MSKDPTRFGQVEVASVDQLWDWFEVNHRQDESIWLVTWKAAHPEKYISRDQVLDALLAYGWIDGRRMKLDGHRTMQLLTKRKEQRWAKTYKERAARLIAEGRMKAAGLAAIEASKASGKWDEMAAIDALHVPDDLMAELSARKAKAWWDNAAPSYRRNVLRWIATAKRPNTRAKRIATVADHAAQSKKVPQY